MRIGPACILLACIALPSVTGHGTGATVVEAVAADRLSAAVERAPVSPRTITHRIARGDAFVTILSRYGVSAAQASNWCEAARDKADLRALVAGRSMDLVLRDQRLVGIRYAVDDQRELVIESEGGAGEPTARLEPIPVTVREVGARGIVTQNFYQAAQQAGLPDAVISAMVDLLGWEIDFNREVRKGDRFRVVYEQRIGQDGQPRKPGRILAADFRGRVSSATAFLYTDDTGKAGYLDAEGRALDEGFLRYPLEFTRISSTFSRSRYHPILKKRRPHNGVDFAARSGTPVRAIGPGRVRWAARKGGLGRDVEIDHGNDFVSCYAHLRGIRRGIRRGVRVKRGELIGWVGMSGLATGPHLHFAIFEKGRYVNPLRIHHPPQPVVVDGKTFRGLRIAMLRKLRAMTGDAEPVPSTSPVILSALAQARHLGFLSLTL